MKLLLYLKQGLLVENKMQLVQETILKLYVKNMCILGEYRLIYNGIFVTIR